MNYFDVYSSYPDHTIAAAWDSQVKEADNIPWLADTFMECGGELFSRFAACYVELSALPRSVRRSLQRRLARCSELTATLPESFQQRGRRLQRKMAWSLGGAALLLALGQGVGAAAIITVTTTNSDIAADGQCSLVEAIVNANNDAATFPDCAAGNGVDTIVLPASANVILSAAHGLRYGQFGNPIGLPLITSAITIEGNGATIARAASAPAFGLMAVRFPGNLTLQSVTLSGGSFGGVSNNWTLGIKNSTISGNSGGGVDNSFGTLAVENSTISGNTAGVGGGIFNYSGTVTIANSTISGNTASTGGGIINCSGPYGSSFISNNSTISGNIANQGGGVSNGPYCGLYFPGGSNLSLNNSLIVGNQAAVAPEIQNVTDCPSPFGCRPNTINANNFNLFGTNGDTGVCGFTPGPTDIVPAPGVGIADILSPLADNGGPTRTHALLAGSPAVDAGNPNGCLDDQGSLLLSDQRGFPRPSAGTFCDIGSYELAASPSNPLQAAGNVALPADSVSVSATCSPPSPPPLAIGAATLATGEAGLSFTGDLMISGGVPPYIVSLIKGALPAGLSLGNDGIISGTISPAAKSAKITVRITDSLNGSVTKTFTITVLKALSVSAKAKTGRVGKNYNASLKIKGGLGPFDWSITAGALPTGLSFNTATGAIAGIPTEAGDFPLTVQVIDALGGIAVETLTLAVK
jgi:Putative Ig domain